MTQSPCCWKAKWVTLTDLCKSSQDGLRQLPRPGQKWEWGVLDLGTGEIGLDWLTAATATTLGVFFTAAALRCKKFTAYKCTGIALHQKCAEMYQPLHGKALGVIPEPNLGGELRRAAPSTSESPGNA